MVKRSRMQMVKTVRFTCRGGLGQQQGPRQQMQMAAWSCGCGMAASRYSWLLAGDPILKTFLSGVVCIQPATKLVKNVAVLENAACKAGKAAC
jgi:hypothetical protein